MLVGRARAQVWLPASTVSTSPWVTCPCSCPLCLLQAAPAPRPPSAQRVYSLGDEEEEEHGGAGADGAERGAWAAELGLLALHASVLLPKQVRLSEAYCMCAVGVWLAGTTWALDQQ